MDHQQSQDDGDESIEVRCTDETVEGKADHKSGLHADSSGCSNGEDERSLGRNSPRAPGSPRSPSSRSSKGSPERKGVPHVYRDFSNVPDAGTVVRKKTGGVATPFPEKLHHMLDIETRDHPSAVSWLSHGRAFIVRDPHEFTDFIMPKYFRQTKLTSFQRQLNLYGYRRLTQGPDAGAYYHELFLRGRPQLCLRMQRQKVKGTGHKQPADVQTEPNFYNMSPSKPSESGDAPVTQLSPPVAASMPQMPKDAPKREIGSAPATVSSFHDMSPGMGGVHTAAQVLKGLSSMPFSLGLSASETGDISNTSNSSPPKPPPVSVSVAKTPSMDTTPVQTDSFASQPPPSMSLLGRVTNIGGSSGQQPVATTSAFFWPPRTAGKSTLIHPSPGLDAASSSSSPPPVHGSSSSEAVVARNESTSKTNAKVSNSPVNASIEKQGNSRPRLITEPSTAKLKGTNARDGSSAPDSRDDSPGDNEPEGTGFGKTGQLRGAEDNKVTKGIETEET